MLKPKNLITALFVLAAIGSAWLYALAGTFNPAGAPGKTMKTLEDIYCKYAGCSATTYTTDSPGAPGSAMPSMREVYDAVPATRPANGRGWVPNGSGAGSTALTQTACEATTTWKWFEDANGDGDTVDPEDGICVQVSSLGAVSYWSGNAYATTYENSYIADYTCAGNFPTGYVATYSGINSGGTADNTWNDGDCALCKADCYDGKKDLPDQGGWTAPNSSASGGVQGPLTHEVLKNWKGTRLPSFQDFYGYCGATSGDAEDASGDGLYHSSGASSDKTIGSTGGNVGRGANGAPYDEYIDLTNHYVFEWLAEKSFDTQAWNAGFIACSNTSADQVTQTLTTRAVFRP